jgi:hypothetical protein
MFLPTAGCRDIHDWPSVLPKNKSGRTLFGRLARSRTPRNLKVLITRPQYEAGLLYYFFSIFFFFFFFAMVVSSVLVLTSAGLVQVAG